MDENFRSMCVWGYFDGSDCLTPTGDIHPALHDDASRSEAERVADLTDQAAHLREQTWQTHPASVMHKAMRNYLQRPKSTAFLVHPKQPSVS